MKILAFISFSVMLLVGCGNDENEVVVNTTTDTDSFTGEEIVIGYANDESKFIFDVIPENMTVKLKKERFKQLIVPAAKRVYLDLKQQHDEVKILVESNGERERIEQLKIKYKAVSDQGLLERLKPHPISIVLAQAAMESAWATSRFFTEAKNVFGIWSFNINEPRIAAGEKRGSKTIWLKKYNTIENSIRDNYYVLARGSAYEEFRKLRLKTDNPHELVKGLDQYSEIGSEYGKELSSMIRYNKFDRFDRELSEMDNLKYN